MEIARLAPFSGSAQKRSISGTNLTVDTVTLLAFNRMLARESVRIFTARVTLSGNTAWNSTRDSVQRKHVKSMLIADSRGKR